MRRIEVPRTLHSVNSSFSFIDPPPTGLYTLSLHDALPISADPSPLRSPSGEGREGVLFDEACLAGSVARRTPSLPSPEGDRKSTRLNSSHTVISYAVFCLKKKNHRPDHGCDRGLDLDRPRR